MKVSFVKLNKVFDIDVKYDGLRFVGQLSPSKFAKLDGKLFGKLDFICDVCTNKSQKQVDEQLNIKLTNKAISIEEEDDLDIVECGEIIDIDDIINSEINALKSEYLKCNDCLKNDN